MQDKFNQFFNDWNGKSLEVEDPSALDQCMDLLDGWVDKLGIPRETIRHSVAYQVWTMPNDLTRQYFDLVQNTATYIPPVGAVAVFGTTVGNSGHVSVVAPGTNIFNLTTFDQNWDTLHYNLNGKPYCRIVTHNFYKGIIGFLVPKNVAPPLTDSQKVVKIYDVAFGPANDSDARNQIKVILKQ